MRVVAVVPADGRSAVGAFRATHEHLRTLRSRGHDVLILTSQCDNAPTVVDGMRVESLGYGAADRLRDADVCISHAGDPLARAGAAAEAAGVPHVVMVHGAPPAAEPEGVDLVAVNSETMAAQVAHWSAPVVVAQPHTRFEDHATTRGDRATLVNTSGPKGVQTFRRVAARCADLPFLAVQGAYGAQVPITVKEQRRNIATLPSQPDMRAVWRRTRVLLMPSEAETWGMVGVEAMCSGIPVIAHPTLGLRESLGDAGIFVDRDDIDGWVRQVRRLQFAEPFAEASAKASARAAELCRGEGTNRFADAVEALA